MTEIIKLIVTVIIMVLCIVFTRGFFSACEAERKGAIWKPYPKKKPKKTFNDEKERRLLVSLENGNVIIMFYSFENENFEHDGVDAWREIPKCYGWFSKQIKALKKER